MLCRSLNHSDAYRAFLSVFHFCTTDLKETPVTDDEIIGELVGKYYRMNPATEDMLFDATELRDGMIVLGDARKDLKENPDEGELYNILKYNRWFTVSKIRHSTDGTTRFQATYSDGHKI